jgi:hypothetical protein
MRRSALKWEVCGAVALAASLVQAGQLNNNDIRPIEMKEVKQAFSGKQDFEGAKKADKPMLVYVYDPKQSIKNKVSLQVFEDQVFMTWKNEGQNRKKVVDEAFLKAAADYSKFLIASDAKGWPPQFMASAQAGATLFIVFPNGAVFAQYYPPNPVVKQELIKKMESFSRTCAQATAMAKAQPRAEPAAPVKPEPKPPEPVKNPLDKVLVVPNPPARPQTKPVPVTTQPAAVAPPETKPPGRGADE